MDREILLENSFFEERKRKKFSKQRWRFDFAVLFFRNMPLCSEKKGIYNSNAIEINSPMLFPSIAIPASCGFSSLYRPFAAPFRA